MLVKKKRNTKAATAIIAGVTAAAVLNTKVSAPGEEEEDTGFSLGDLIGGALDQFKSDKQDDQKDDK